MSASEKNEYVLKAYRPQAKAKLPTAGLATLERLKAEAESEHPTPKSQIQDAINKETRRTGAMY